MNALALSIVLLLPRHTAYAYGLGEDAGWCDSAVEVNIISAVANIAEAVEVLRHRAGQEDCRDLVEPQGNTTLPCAPGGLRLKIKLLVSDRDNSKQKRGWDVGSWCLLGGEDPCVHSKLCRASLRKSPNSVLKRETKMD